MLVALGYATVPAASGGEALALIAYGPKIDLVLADFDMPEMTGIELAERSTLTVPRCRLSSSPATAIARLSGISAKHEYFRNPMSRPN